MTRTTAIALYFGSYATKFIGVGVILIGLGFAVDGWCMARQCRGEDQ